MELERNTLKTDRLDPENTFVIIMAGGRGERFWPMSREKTPKQLIRLLGEHSFLQETVNRLVPMVPLSNIFVITNRAQARAVSRQLPGLPEENVIAEPIGRDTCAAVALGAALVGARSENAVMAVLPADHVIPNPDAFRQVLSDCFALASRQSVIVTIGIPPTEPATGYGYIHVGDPLTVPKQEATPSGEAPGKTEFFQARRFVEKPRFEVAQEYLRSGEYRWNAGMFVWSFETIQQALLQHQPRLAALCGRWKTTAREHPERIPAALRRDYPGLDKVSVDYALLEKADNVVVAEGAFDWDDLGAWPALERHLNKDAAGNASVGDVVTVDSSNNVIFDGRTKGKTPIGLVGVRDSIVVLTQDAVLVAAKADAQKIKELVRQLGMQPEHRHLV